MTVELDQILPQFEAAQIDITIRVSTRLNVTQVAARRKVNVLVAERVSNMLLADEPNLLQTPEQGWVWRVPVDLTFPSHGRVGRVGEVDVDAHCGELRYTDALLTRMANEARGLAQQALSPMT